MRLIKHQNIASSAIAVTDTATLLFALINTAGSTNQAATFYNDPSNGGPANGIIITPEDGNIRLSAGLTPTALLGTLLNLGSKYFIPGTDLSVLKLIRVSGAATVKCSIDLVRSDENDNFSANAETVTVTLSAADIEIGAVELKNASTDDRALISDANTARNATDHVLEVQALDAAGAVLSTSALATAAKQPTLGTGLMAGSAPTTLATDDTQMGAVGAASDVDGNVHGQLRFAGEELDDIHDECIDIVSNTGFIKTAVETLDNAISGNEMQVDVITQPARTAANDGILIYGSDDGGTNKRIIKTDAGGAIQIDLEVAEVTANAGTNLNTSALALEAGGNLASIKAKTDNIPALGQALEAASVPVVLPAAQITTLTPPAAITGFALETGGNLASVKTNTDNIPAKGNAAMAASTPVTIASDDTLTSAIKTAVELIDNAVDGNYLNVNQNIAGTDVASNSGNKDAATQRVVLASDDILTLAVKTAVEAINTKLVTGTDIGDVTVNNAAGASAVNIQDGGNSITVDNADITSSKTALELLDNAVDGNYLNTNMNVAGTDVAGGSGAASAQTLRTISATDSPEVTSLSNISKATIGASAPTIDSYATVAINLTTGADQVLVSSAANKQIWVYGYGLTCGDAAGQTVSLQDEDNTALTGIMEFAQYGGISVPPSGNFSMPVFKLGTDKDLEVDITGGDVDGWLSYAILSV